MTVQSAKEQNIFNSSTSGSDWVMIDGMTYKKQTDEKGDYIVKGGTEKVYLAEYYNQQRTDAKKAKLQQEITGFFSDQIKDFDDWTKYYGAKAGKLNEEITLLKESIKTNNDIVAKNTSLLKPLYAKYNTTDISAFRGTDKTNGENWTKSKKAATKTISDAWSRISVKNMFIETYTRLMNHSNFCGAMVEKIAAAALGR